MKILTAQPKAGQTGFEVGAPDEQRTLTIGDAAMADSMSQPRYNKLCMYEKQHVLTESIHS